MSPGSLVMAVLQNFPQGTRFPLLPTTAQFQLAKRGGNLKIC